jgi:hypothetical protein
METNQPSKQSTAKLITTIIVLVVILGQIELIHDQLPLAVPCYDLVPVTELTLGPPYGETSGTPGSLDLTGGEYKT